MIYKCKHCGKEFSDRYKLAGHSTWCEKNPKFLKEDRLKSLSKARSHIDLDKKKKDNTELICQYCGKICIGKNSLINHERLCKDNPHKQMSSFISYNEKKEHAWNKGLSAKNNISIRNQSEQLKKHWEENGVPNKGKKMSVEQKEKIRKANTGRKYTDDKLVNVRYACQHKIDPNQIVIYCYETNKYYLSIGKAAKELDFERAMQLRDILFELKTK